MESKGKFQLLEKKYDITQKTLYADKNKVIWKERTFTPPDLNERIRKNVDKVLTCELALCGCETDKQWQIAEAD